MGIYMDESQLQRVEESPGWMETPSVLDECRNRSPEIERNFVDDGVMGFVDDGIMGAQPFVAGTLVDHVESISSASDDDEKLPIL